MRAPVVPKIPRDLESRTRRPITSSHQDQSRNNILTLRPTRTSQSQSLQFLSGNAPSSANHLVRRRHDPGRCLPKPIFSFAFATTRHNLRSETRDRSPLLFSSETTSLPPSNEKYTMASIARQALLAPARSFAARGVAARPMMGVAGFHASSRRCDILPAGPRTSCSSD